MTNIKVFIDGAWEKAKPHQIKAFQEFKRKKEPIAFKTFTIERPNPNQLTHMRYLNGTIVLIADHNDVKIFRPLIPGWHKIPSHQAWAYFDFNTKDKKRITYTSTSILSSLDNTYIMLPFGPPDTFSISRDSNSDIYLEPGGRLSDDPSYRNNYLAFYRRMTDIEIPLPKKVIPSERPHPYVRPRRTRKLNI